MNSVLYSLLQPPCCSPQKEGINCKCALPLAPIHFITTSPGLVTFNYFSKLTLPSILDINTPLLFQTREYLTKIGSKLIAGGEYLRCHKHHYNHSFTFTFETGFAYERPKINVCNTFVDFM